MAGKLTAESFSEALGFEVVDTAYSKPWPEGRPPSAINPNVPACYAKLSRGRLGPRGDGRCYAMAMWNGRAYTRCKAHGGNLSGKLKTGQYSEKVGKRLLELAAEMEGDKSLASIEEQLKLGAAILKDQIIELEKRGIGDLDPKERKYLMDMLESLSRLSEKFHRIRNGITYNIRNEYLLLSIHGVSAVINKVLHDLPDRRDRIAKEMWKVVAIQGDELKPDGKKLAQAIASLEGGDTAEEVLEGVCEEG